MIHLTCDGCNKPLTRSPSKVWRKNYCSRACYGQNPSDEFLKGGEKFRYGNKQNPPSHYKKLAILLSNDNHPSWKGSSVSYRGLHQWVRRKKGKPMKCSHCGKESKTPKVIQWANIDGTYRRHLDDFIPLCASCHKIYDIRIQSNRRSQSATQ
jgi:hypothetical protein